MARVSIGTAEKARACSPPAGVSGSVRSRCYFDGDGDPVHLHHLSLPAGTMMTMEPVAMDRLAYVWEGTVDAGGRLLEGGSSLIVEHGATLTLLAQDGGASILLFSGSRLPDRARTGGHVHLLPRALVPRIPTNASGTSGALHADGNCPTCEMWLNENRLIGRADAPNPTEALRGTHAHPEDEIIFVTEGQVRLGARLFGRGTALAIAAHTLYGFSPGPDGMSFITFRPGRTDTIRFASGGDYAPSTYFAAIGPIAYLEPLAS